jgi:hypothetical protein
MTHHGTSEDQAGDKQSEGIDTGINETRLAFGLAPVMSPMALCSCIFAFSHR